MENSSCIQNISEPSAYTMIIFGQINHFDFSSSIF